MADQTSAFLLLHVNKRFWARTLVWTPVVRCLLPVTS